MEHVTTPAWMPKIEITNTSCKDYQHLYANCGCIHKDTQSLTVHWKECIYTTHSKMPEEKYQASRRDIPCKEVEIIYVLFDGTCLLCNSGPQIITRSRNSVRRAGYKVQSALKVEERTPPRQKPITDNKPNPRTDAEIARRVALWQSEIQRREHRLLRRIEDRKEQRRNAYKAFIASERRAEVDKGIPPADQFRLFNFTGGEGGDLLSTATGHEQALPCTYCGSTIRPLNGPPEKLPCGCLVHRDCAADQFLLTEHGLSRQKAKCPCGARFNLRRLHLNFEDDA
ncbi:hypothetical protein BKA65DRAFT_551390 [Rhexocercosporidium sp. MPI-PUGE-AT-0058]|nr:hypothetical protein BKA65DRAFT_551390 [Rhexocercosporidium sp. MPI-PUGE-AT-0058]